MIVLHTDLFDVLVTSVKSIDGQMDVFAYTYEQLQRGGRPFKQIDVRFEKPIIKL
jgi:hypothetical protein